MSWDEKSPEVASFSNSSAIGTQALRRETPGERLQIEKKRLTHRLTEVEEALKLLEKNPDIERLLTILH